MNPGQVANLFDPSAFLQLVGHPLRWQLVAELARSDRMVHELTGLVREPQNLVSYHLGKLRERLLVSAHRSSADRRDTYYSLDLARLGDQLSTTGAALHPALRLTPIDRSSPPFPTSRVLFLCTGNSARSQMAEAMLRASSSGTVEVFSAGSKPRPIHPNAVRVMADEHGIDLTSLVPKHLDLFVEQQFDWVISLCDQVREVCPEFPGRPSVVHWSIPNPAVGGPDEETYPLFQKTAAELATRIGYLLPAIADSGATQ